MNIHLAKEHTSADMKNKNTAQPDFDNVSSASVTKFQYIF